MIKFILLFLCVFFSCAVNSQSGIVSYSVKFTNDKKAEVLDKIAAEMALMEFTLIYDSESSFFEEEKYIPLDLLHSNVAKSMLSAKGEYKQIGKKAYSKAEVDNVDYLVDRSYLMKDWELSTESVEINNYTCYKATHSQFNKRSGKTDKIVAWYTVDIPVGFGPLGYGGLPGLILQLEYKYAEFKVEKIVLNSKKVKVPSLKKAEIITVADLVQKMRAARKVTED